MAARTHTEESTSSSRNSVQTCLQKKNRSSHPVVPVAAPRDVRRLFGTSGGFEVEVVVDEGHAEPRLHERAQPVNKADSGREISAGGLYLDV